MRTKVTAFSFKLASVSTMYRWAEILNIDVVRAGEILQDQRAKRNYQIVKLHAKNMHIKDIAKKLNMRVPTVYEVLQDRDRWRHYAPKRSTTQEVSASDVLGVFNDLFIAKAVKTNRYGVVGY
jgi:transcriptional regulator with XRE-family HTH domain